MNFTLIILNVMVATAFVNEAVSEEKEITAIDYFGSQTDKSVKPSWWKVKRDFGLKSKIVFCERNGCWSVERKVKGFINEGIFTPFPGQSVTYKISIPESRSTLLIS